MIFITQLVYILDGQEDIFDEFEDIAIPAISRYHGKLLLRVRPAVDAYIESNMENPYEIHLIEFEADEDFVNFIEDEERQQFLHLKNKSIRSAILIKGEKL